MKENVKNNCKMNERGKHLNKDRSTKTVYRSFFTSGSHPSGIYYKSKNKEDTEKNEVDEIVLLATINEK